MRCALGYQLGIKKKGKIMLNPYNVQPNEDGEYIYCDFCDLPVDSLDGVTDGFVVGCGSVRGNGCGDKL